MKFDKVTIVNAKKYIKLSDNVLKGKYSFVTFILNGSATEVVGLYNKDKKEIILSDDVSELIFK